MVTPNPFASTLVGAAEPAVDIIDNILESSTEYSIIRKDLDGNILLWSEGARRLYGYEPEEIVGKLNSIILDTPEDVADGKPRKIMDIALRDGKWEGTLARLCKDGRRFTARVTISDPGWYAAAKLPDTAAQNQIPNDSILTVVQSSS